MPFNIESFKQNISDFGTLQTNKFEVIIKPPDTLLNSSIGNNSNPATARDTIKLIKFRASAVNSPGVAILCSDVARYGIGPIQRYPYTAQFNFIELTMISDRYGDLWQFWHNWMKTIYEFTGTESATGSQANRIPTYTAQYKDDYSTIMQIILYDNFGNAITRTNLYDIFPMTFSDTPLNWEDENSLLKIHVTLTFKEFTIVGSTITDNLNNSSTKNNNNNTKINISP